MEALLFLVHRIPYPPNKGDKIRSFHILRNLSSRYRVHLGCFVDDPRDWKHAERLRRYCAESCLVPLSPRRARLKSARGLLTGTPLTLPYFFDRRLQRWVGERLDSGSVSRVLVFSSAMAQYVLDRPLPRGTRVVFDFVDVDSDKWRQYSEKKRWPMSAVYARESRALLRFERRAAAASDATVFVTEAEAEHFRQLAPESARRVFGVENGVDSDFFSPERDYANPYEAGRPVFVFTGAMDYWANVDAVRWFAQEVLPGLREQSPGARFCIVGSRPTEEVNRLGRHPGVTVTGEVEDVRPFLAHARAAVAPLRIARGVQNKVLEAMAMGRPVLASPQAMEGLELEEPYPLVAEEPAGWIRLARNLIEDDELQALGGRLRRWVLVRHAWSSKLERLHRLLEDDVGAT